MVYMIATVFRGGGCTITPPTEDLLKDKPGDNQYDRQLQLLGYMYVKAVTTEKELDINININGSANKDQTCTLTIEKLSEKSSAVYFCAARYHSDTPH
uniref:Immunoglobulin V-set domain-containing protein n=1 Tax=Echeneis naucrates TaxID=173247 RepID=A0A665W5E6_ECHNA